MYCTNCNRFTDGNICPECGAKLNRENKTSTASSYSYGKDETVNKTVKKSGRKGSVLIVCLSLLVILGMVALFVNIGKQRRQIETAKKLLEQMMDTDNYESIIEMYKKAVSEGLDDEEINKKMQEVYSKWFEENLDNENVDFDELFDIVNDISEEFPGEYEKTEEMIKQIMEKIKNSPEFNSDEMSEEFKEIFESMESTINGDQSFDFGDTYDQMMDIFSNYMKDETKE